MKIGRNDPSCCGSGKKYKHCCVANESALVVDLVDRIWRQTREAIDGYAVAMLRFIEESYGRDGEASRKVLRSRKQRQDSCRPH
jgi:hypothetical protein